VSDGWQIAGGVITERGDPRDYITNQLSLPPTRKGPIMAEVKADSKRDYIVLAKTEDGHWEELGPFSASSDSAAKRLALAANKPEGAEVVAVTARSWKPEDLKPELRFR
jgi:hypothetical protein